MNENPPEGPQYSDDRDPQRLGEILGNFVVGPPTAEDIAKKTGATIDDATFRRDALLTERLEIIGTIKDGDRSAATLNALSGINQELQLVEGELDTLQGGPEDSTVA